MKTEASKINELNAAAAFGRQAPIFDQQYGADKMINYKRERVRDVVMQVAQPGMHMLELNGGTGEDAMFFAQQELRVHVTDVSPGMLEQLKHKIIGIESITSECCSYTDLQQLQDKGPYDIVFSNFAGLNCSNNLEMVFSQFDSLLKPGGRVVLVVLPGFCLWESLLIFRGKFAVATRRFFSSKGRRAKVEGLPFTCWYHSPKKVKQLMRKDFQHELTEGLCTIVPPSYISGFASKYSKVFDFLCKLENKFKRSWPFKYIGDYYIIQFKKNSLSPTPVLSEL